MHPILGLVKDDRLRAVKDGVCNLCVPVRRKAVHEYCIRLGTSHEGLIYLVRLEIGARFVASCSKPILVHTSVYTAFAPSTAFVGSC